MDENNDKLKKCLLQYSLDDLLSSFFVLSLWLPNIASPIKIQYLYVVIESLHRELPQVNKINSYEDFESVCKSIISILPSFAMLEDYIPEPDWGEIKYYFDNKMYKIFYGADLSNSYDFYYAFEIIHRNFKDYYTKTIKHSVLDEFEFCLSLQNYLLDSIKQSKAQGLEINPGDLGIPSKEFWEEVSRFLTQFTPEGLFDQDLISKYTSDFDTGESLSWPELRKFAELAYSGKNCPYYFIKKGRKYFPIMPRKYFSILFDRWGIILKQHYKQIQNEIKNPEIGIGIELFKFIRDRINNDNIFGLVSPLDAEQKPYKTTFTTAIRSKNKLFLLHVIPPSVNKNILTDYLIKVTPELKESIKLVSTYPTRLMLWVQKQIVEFKPKNEGESLVPIILTVIPYCTTEMISLTLPEDLPGRTIGLDQLVGILDEIEDCDELSEFYDYNESLQSSFMLAMTSYLDKYGSFKDSHGVLIPGAREYDSVNIDCNWGSDYRYRSLSKFWQKFPENNIFGHPRSWIVPEESKNVKSAIFKSRTFFGYVYYQEIGLTSFFVNSPIDRMNYEQGKITDFMMQTIYDALEVYENTLNELGFAKEKNKFQILISPISLVKECADLGHLKYLVPNTGLWLMDISRLNYHDYGIRVVFDDKLIFSASQNIKDRSIQINFLLDILEQINKISHETKLPYIKQKLEQEKGKKYRMKLFAIKKKISFPELTKTVLPEEKDWKMTDKIVAQLANGIGVKPGNYKQEEAKVILNNLRDELVKRINLDVSKYNIKQAIPLLIEKIDALANEHLMKKTQIEESFDQEVEYERESKTSEDHIEFLGHHKNYRYLIEKFVQIQPNGKQQFTISDITVLLAFVDRIIQIYNASDVLQYAVYSVEVIINDDFIVSIINKIDIQTMQKNYSREQAQIDLGIIGNKNDIPNSRMSVTDYLDSLDIAFKIDFKFSFKDLINVTQIMSLWPVYKEGVAEHPYYSATTEEISQICSKGIKGFNPQTTDKILQFLTLEPGELLRIKGDPNLATDLPIWEYNKRLTKYTIRPLIKIDKEYFWGPHSVERTGRLWGGISHTNRLPADITAPTIINLIEGWHKDLEVSLVNKIEEITKRHTFKIRKNVYFHQFDPKIKDIGDCDVLALLEDKNILLNIESKIIDPAYCLKDVKRIHAKLFGRTKTDGSFEKGYLQKVEQRENYLKQNSLEIIRKLNWAIPKEPPKIVSIFTTQISYWWTKFPTIKTEVNFIKIKLLDDFIKNM